MSANDQSPMTREELVFALAHAQGMLFRLLADCQRLLDNPNADLRTTTREDMREAREMLRDQARQFHGKQAANGEKG